MIEQSQVFSLADKRICFIHASWHVELVDGLKTSFFKQGADYQLAQSQVDVVSVPGSLEIPLQAQLRAKTGLYDAIVVAGFVIDGGIYRHDFVAQAVLDSVMKIQLEQEIPVIYAVLTPHHFHDHGVHESFFAEHLKTKGVETANALYQTLKCCDDVVNLVE
ncbi:MAG: 6,7-dimethyl-8-ribityllumazine synthase (EC [uncultured Thiotrichaceae bacterium]|uniref:6,7-dimethyl-8-ribityllumazine synthase n=1 Tax=uncultured Thiotrichaceae bacterium TaxID=298394 RepID=A0A6S6THF6_9GAMM|nr:MAG: 6,7-dimethyl-8-ribityllumazine synthase (EC [uncultured Thiotrichaceae bacterium]